MTQMNSSEDGGGYQCGKKGCIVVCIGLLGHPTLG